MEGWIVILGLALPLLYAPIRSRGVSRDDYLLNARQTSLLLTLGSVICSNIGIGTFLALFLFGAQSPVLGHVVAASYAAGLLLCAALAGTIHRAARATDRYGMVDYVAAAHGVRHTVLIWVPVAVAFSLRTVVQVLALGLIVDSALDLGPTLSLAVSGGVVGTYTAIGGYRVATETDLLQATIVLIGLVLIAGAVLFSDGGGPSDRVAFFDLGPWGLPFLVAVMMFLPFSAVLSVDNWQRIATADTARTARHAYVIGAVICLPIYVLLAHVGQRNGAAVATDPGEVLEVFRALMPFGLPALADLVLMAAVMSSIDTFVMPLVTVLARTRASLARIRLAVIAFFALLTAVALGIGDALTGVVAAFNVLVVFLPAVFGALLLGDRAPRAAALSMGLGVGLTLGASVLALDLAALIGFAASIAIYAAMRRVDRRLDPTRRVDDAA